MSGVDKRTSLKFRGINYWDKRFYSIGPETLDIDGRTERERERDRKREREREREIERN